MKYNININQTKCIEFGLNLQQGAIMDIMSQLSTWADPISTEQGIYYYLSRGKLIDELPIISGKKNTFQIIIKSLKDKGLLDHYHDQVSKKGYYRLSELGKTFTLDEKNHQAGGKISPTLSEKNHHNNITNNNITNNNIHSLTSNEVNSFIKNISTNNTFLNKNDVFVEMNNKESSFVELNNKNDGFVELNNNKYKIKQIFESNQKCGCISKSTKKTCLRKASYLIDGKLYCNQHSRDILGNIINNNIEQGTFEKLWDWYGKKDAKQAAKKYFDKYIKTEYDINLLRYALPKYVESVKDKKYLVLLRTYLCEQRYLDYKEEFDNLNKEETQEIKQEENIEIDHELKFKRSYDN